MSLGFLVRSLTSAWALNVARRRVEVFRGPGPSCSFSRLDNQTFFFLAVGFGLRGGVVLTGVEQLLQLPRRKKQPGRNFDVLGLNALGFTQFGVVLFEDNLAFFSRQAQCQLALFAHVTEHMPV